MHFWWNLVYKSFTPKTSKIIGKFGWKLPQKNQPTWPTIDRLTPGVGSSYPSFAIWSIKSNTISHFLQGREPHGTSWECRGVLFPGRKPGPRSNPRQRKSFRLGFFGWENTVGAKKKFWVARKNLKEYGPMIWVDLEFAYNIFAYNQTACSKITPGHIFQPGSIPIRLIRFRRMLRISQGLGLGGIHSRKSKQRTLEKADKFAIGSSFFLGFFVVHDFISGGV